MGSEKKPGVADQKAVESVEGLRIRCESVAGL